MWSPTPLSRGGWSAVSWEAAVGEEGTEKDWSGVLQIAAPEQSSPPLIWESSPAQMSVGVQKREDGRPPWQRPFRKAGCCQSHNEGGLGFRDIEIQERVAGG